MNERRHQHSWVVFRRGFGSRQFMEWRCTSCPARTRENPQRGRFW